LQVTWEDQSMINTFSKLVNRLDVRQETLVLKKQDKEYLDDVEMELELADDADAFPYRIGDAFVHLPLEQVQSRLSAEKESAEESIDQLEQEVETIKEEMAGLKVKLKRKYGDSINLDN
ncbi:Prefoldin beta-like protein, partial [Protomyces lactucae-debilis]